jgi:hypothetical protein
MLGSPYPRLVVLVAVWTLAVIVFTVWGLVDLARAHGRSDATPVNHRKDYRADAGSPDVPAQLAPRGDLEILSAVLFQRDLWRRTREIEYEVSSTRSGDGGASAASTARLADGPLETRVGQFVDVQASRELDDAYISAVAEARHDRVIVRVDFDRRSGALGSPGTYIGTISIVDPQVERIDIPFTVSLAYPWWQFVCVLFLVMLVPATLYLWFLRGSFAGDAGLSMASLDTWLFSRNALMSIGTGVAAAVSVWTATYFSSNAWGVSITAATAMFGATFSAFIAASTAVTAAAHEAPVTVSDAQTAGQEARDGSAVRATSPAPAT